MKGNRFGNMQPAHKIHQDMLLTQQVGTICSTKNIRVIFDPIWLFF